MNLNPQIIANISTIISSTLFFLVILTFTKKSSAVIGYRFLSLFLLFLTLNFTDEALKISGTYVSHPALMLIFQPGTYAIAPSFYLASVYLTSIDKKLKLKLVLHFIPYLLLLTLCIFTFLITPEAIVAHKPKANHIEKIASIFLLTLLFIQIFWYLFISLRQLRKHRKSIPLFLSSFAGNDYKWLNQIIIGLGMLSMIWLLEVIAAEPLLSLLASIIYLFSFYYIGVQIMRQKDIISFFPNQNQIAYDLVSDLEIGGSPSIAIAVNTASAPLKKKVLTDEKVIQLKHQLLEFMSRDKPYLDAEITLQKLSKMMLSNTYHMSYLLNDCLEENFYTFINRYRIDECMRMLKNPSYDHLTILGIAFECGFSSKTSFNISFKKVTGMSPREYRTSSNEKMD
jgi:AraC-like DNA-binding protein